MTPWIASITANTAIMLLLVALGLAIGRLPRSVRRVDSILIPLAVGSMLALVWFEFVPHLSAELPETLFAVLVLAGILGFALLENILHWHHCRDLDPHEHRHGHDNCVHGIHEQHSTLMTIGTFMHNCFHWVVLFGAFSIDLTSGILLSLVILLHAIPQNLANSLMNRDSIKSPLITASGGVIGALSLFPFLSFGAPFESTILALTAINTGWLLYIALSDLLPLVQNRTETIERFFGMAFVGLGALLVALLQAELHHFMPDGHTHEHAETTASDAW